MLTSDDEVEGRRVLLFAVCFGSSFSSGGPAMALSDGKEQLVFKIYPMKLRVLCERTLLVPSRLARDVSEEHEI